MASYAAETTVPTAKSRAEIEQTVERYGATGFMSGWHGDQAMVAFEAKGRRLRFMLPLPSRADRAFTHRVDGRSNREVALSAEAATAAYEQACRQRWRALALAIKAKLEAVQSGIATFDEEFMAHIVTAGGATVGELTMNQLDVVVGTGKLPPLLPGPRA